ncbi:hypothetical protein GK047_28565 [Paenibacillus sp. SYP-B3998]|uniref:Uncharacterized protein n=1 Tax=Paenibacillus sp. SYP-B3998 TaxID=2678564 RepID=A0A6G4A7S8_9BACL|nr:hypothetical protein [Paenibacillus sp. SYP-B3998]NEW09859.1 hypothetical protein [Paenibacillus sp. SYP-B3998]
MGKKSKKYSISKIDIFLGDINGFKYPQYIIQINDLSLNDYLNLHTKSSDFDLLLPPIAMFNNEDQQKAINLIDFRNVTMPLLICSDDMDFSCTIVSAYVVEHDDIVLWKHFGYGLDISTSINVPALAFDKIEYSAFTNKFKAFALENYGGV